MSAGLVTRKHAIFGWKDPMGVVHAIDTVKFRPTYLTRVTYMTWCGHDLSVDALNALNKVYNRQLTCMKCLASPTTETYESLEKS
jgi:hypothetical protein